MNLREALVILNLQEGYTEEELKKNFRKLSKKYHPDIAGEEGTQQFIKVKTAFEIISNSRKIVSKNVFTHKSIFTIIVKN